MMNIKQMIRSFAVIGITSMALLANAQDHQSGACKDAANKEDCMHAQMNKHWAEREAKLHDALKLTAEQEPAWKTFTDSLHQHMTEMQAQREAMPTRAEMDKLSAPEQLEQHLAMMQTHMNMMQNQLASLKAFYAVLTPDQQVTLNMAMKKMAQHHHWQHQNNDAHP